MVGLLAFSRRSFQRHFPWVGLSSLQCEPPSFCPTSSLIFNIKAPRRKHAILVGVSLPPRGPFSSGLSYFTWVIAIYDQRLIISLLYSYILDCVSDHSGDAHTFQRSTSIPVGFRYYTYTNMLSRNDRSATTAGQSPFVLAFNRAGIKGLLVRTLPNVRISHSRIICSTSIYHQCSRSHKRILCRK